MTAPTTVTLKVAVQEVASAPLGKVKDALTELGSTAEKAAQTSNGAFDQLDKAAKQTADLVGKAVGDAASKITSASSKVEAAGQAAGELVADAISKPIADTDIGAAVRKATGGADSAAKSGGSGLGDQVAGAMEQAIRGADTGAAVKQATSGANDAATTAGKGLGDDLGGGLTDAFGGSDLGGALMSMIDKSKEAGEAGGGKLSGFIMGGLAGLGTAIAAVVTAAVLDGFAQAGEKGLTLAALGVTDERATELGNTAGELYASGWAEGIPEANQLVRDALAQMSFTTSDALHGDALTAVVKQATGVAKAAGSDVTEVVRAAQQMVTTGLSPNITSAMDVLGTGVQGNANKAGDLFDTFNEYSTQFRKLGIDAPTAMGLISQGIANGARDADIVGDSFKELSIRTVDGSKETVGAYELLGLDAQDMQRRFLAGGDTAAAATQEVLDKINGLADPIQQQAAWGLLFGTQFEDMGASVNLLDLTSARTEMDNTGGKAAEMASQIESSANRIDLAYRAAKGYIIAQGEEVSAGLAKNSLESTGWFDQMGQGALNAATTVGGALSTMAGQITDFLGMLVGADPSTPKHADLDVLSTDQQVQALTDINNGEGWWYNLFGGADGGPVPGTGGPREDNILLRGSAGEFMINAVSTAKHRSLVEWINGPGRNIDGFADGGQILEAALTNPALTALNGVVTRFEANYPRPGGGGGGSPYTGPLSGGVEQWRSLVGTALTLIGQSQSLVDTVLFQMQTESSGNRNAINLTDSNARKGTPSKGLMQVIGPTFDSYALAPYNEDIFDPLSNILAGMRYAIDRYGSIAAGMTGHAYDTGGIMPSGTAGWNTSGRDELILNPSDTAAWKQGDGGGTGTGTTINNSVVVNVDGDGDPVAIRVEVEKALVRIMRDDRARSLTR